VVRPPRPTTPLARDLNVARAMNPVVRGDIVVSHFLDSVGGYRHKQRRDRLLDILDVDLDWHMVRTTVIVLSGSSDPVLSMLSRMAKDDAFNVWFSVQCNSPCLCPHSVHGPHVPMGRSPTR